MSSRYRPLRVGTTTTGTVRSEDGTTIGYRQLGQGPGVVLLHGTASSGRNHLQLAEALADAFTVYVPDRRGRGLSGPYGADDGPDQEVQDVAALLAGTGAHGIFGISSGGIVALLAALSVPAIRRAAVYEPPLFMDGSLPAAVLTRCDREMAQGRTAAALITAMQGAQMGPWLFRAMPRILSERLTTMAMNQEERKPEGDDVPMRKLAPTLHYDLRLVAEMSGKLDTFRAIRATVLLLGGSKSPTYLKAALQALEGVIPAAERIELPGLDHAASWNRDRGGQPGRVSDALRRFFR